MFSSLAACHLEIVPSNFLQNNVEAQPAQPSHQSTFAPEWHAIGFRAYTAHRRDFPPVPECAFITALAMAAVEGTVETDPMPLAPNGLVVEVESIVSRIWGGIFVALGIA
jgi:hypothetical protein